MDFHSMLGKRAVLAAFLLTTCFMGMAISSEPSTEVTTGSDNVDSPPEGSLRSIAASVEAGKTITFLTSVAEVALVRSNAISIGKNGVTIMGNSTSGFNLESRLTGISALAIGNPRNVTNLKNQIRSLDAAAAAGLTGLTATSTAGSLTMTPLVQANPGTTGLGLENLYIHDVYAGASAGLISAAETTANGNDVALGNMVNIVFSNNNIKGTGLVAVRNLNLNRSATIGNFKNALFYGNSIDHSSINGGGIVGAYANSTSGLNSVAIGAFENAVFSQNSLTLTGNIEGGGLIGARSGGQAEDLSIGAIRGSVFVDNKITSGGEIWGGGLIGVYTTMCPSKIGMGGLYDTVFTGNQVTARNSIHGALVSGGVISSGGYVISNTQFIDNKITSTTGAVYGGALAINTNYTGGGGTHKVTLTATSGQKTVFSGNVISDSSGTRQNSIYMGVIGRNSPGNGHIEISPELGGSVELYDPIRVNMTHASPRTFAMTVNGPGRFVWGGSNVIEARGGSTVTFGGSSNSTLESDYQLVAKTFKLSLHLAGGAIIAFDPERNPDSALFSFDGASGHQFIIDNGATVTTSKRVGTAVDYMLAVGGSSMMTSINLANLNLGGNLSSARLENNDTELWVTLDASNNGTLSWSGAINGSWDGSTANWTGDFQSFADGDKVVFGSGASTASVVVTAAGVTVADMDITQTGYTFTGGKITGSTTNSTGLPAAGTLAIADGVSAAFWSEIDFEGGIAIGLNGELILNYMSAIDNDNIISGAGSLKKDQVGVLTLSGVNTYTGGTTIENGALVAANASAVGSGSVTVNSPGVFDMAFVGDAIFGNDITGTGSVQHSGAGRLLLSGVSDHSGETRVLDGVLVIRNEAALSATSGVAISQNAGLEIDNGADMNFSAPLSGDGSLVKKGSGVLTLSGNNSHAGGTEIAAGSVRVAHDAALGTLSASGEAGVVRLTGNDTGIVVDNGRIVRNSFEIGAGLTGTAIIANANFTVNTPSGRNALTLGAGTTLSLAANGGNIFLNGGVGGSGSITKSGGGAVQIAAASDFGGTTDVISGAFRVASNAVYGNGAVGSSFSLANGATLAGQGTIHAADITIEGTLSPDSVLATAGFDPGALHGSVGSLILGGAGTGTVALDGAILHVDLSGQNRSDHIMVTQGLNFGATNNVDIGVFQSGTFIIMTAAGMTNADISNFNSTVTLNGMAIAGRMQAALTIDGDRLVLTTNVDSRQMTWTNAAGTNAWDYGSANWSGHPTGIFAAGDYAVFAGSPGGAVSVGMGGVQTSGMNVVGDYTFDGGSITGVVGEIGGVATDGKLKINGNVVFNNASNYFAGGIELDGGSVAFNLSEQLGDGGNGIRVNADAAMKANSADIILGNGITIASGATLTMDTSNGDGLTLAGEIGGGGNLVKAGSGSLSLTAANTGHSGTTTVSSGVLRLQDAGGLGSGTVHLADGTSLEIANAANIANAVSGQGSVVKTGSGAAVLSGASSYSGGTAVNGGSLTADGIAALGDNANPGANRITVTYSANLELSLAASDVGGLANLFRRTALADGGSFTIAAKDDMVLADDLSLSAAAGSGVVLAGTDKSITLDSMRIGLADGYLSVAAGMNLRTVGEVDVDASEIRVSGSLDLSAGSVLATNGSVRFEEGASITVTATDDSDIGRLLAEKDIDFAGKTTVHFGHEADYYKGQAIMTAGGSVRNFDNLHSAFYTLELVGGTIMIRDLLGFTEIQDNLFGPDGQNVNVAAGGQYVDANWEQMSPGLREQLENFVKHLDDAGVRTETAHTAFQQLYGEYGAYASTFHRITSQRFTGAMKNRVNQKMTANRVSAFLSAASVSSGRAYASPYYQDFPRYRDDEYGYDREEYAPRQDYGYGARYYADEYETETCGPAGGFWGGAFGSWAEQDSKSRISGYEYDSQGLLLGYDHQVSEEFLVGIAGAYSTGDLKVGGLASKYDADVVQVGAYANYQHESNLYVTVNVAYGYGWNDVESRPVFGGSKKGEYHTRSYAANIEVGYTIEMPADFHLIPSFGFDYTHLSRDGWRETPSNEAIANWFEKRRSNLLDIPVGVRLTKVFRLGDSRYIAPEIRASWIYSAGDYEPTATTGLVGADASMSVEGVRPGDSRWQVGAGLKAQFSERISASVDYNFELRDKFREHNLSAELGLSF